MYLAVGFDPEQDFSWSIGVDTDNPQTVADALKDAGGVVPSQILLIVNGPDGPNVIGHWKDGDEYNQGE
jgi:hypothetical protein